MATTQPLSITRLTAWRFDDVAAILTTGSSVLADEVLSGRTLVLRVAPDPTSGVSWPVIVHVDRGRVGRDAVVVGLRWEAGAPETILPSFDGRLTARPSAGGTELALTGRYRPPPGWPDGRPGAAERVGDRWFAHRLARIDERLGPVVEGAADTGGRTGCRLCRWVNPPRHCHGLLVWDQGRLGCDINGPDCIYRLAHPLGAPRRPEEAVPGVA